MPFTVAPHNRERNTTHQVTRGTSGPSGGIASWVSVSTTAALPMPWTVTTLMAMAITMIPAISVFSVVAITWRKMDGWQN
jgi:hypothetical protein